MLYKIKSISFIFIFLFVFLNNSLAHASVQEGELANWAELNLSRFSKTKLSDEGLSKCKKLRSLNLSANLINSDAGLSGLTNLEWLSLAYGTQITEKSVRNLTKLRWLDLEAGDLPASVLQFLTNLTHLDLTANTLVDDPIVKRLTHLNTLVLESNRLITEKSLSHLPYLTDLNLRSYSAVSFSDFFTQLLALDITLDSTITEQDLAMCTNLTRLVAAGLMDLKRIPSLPKLISLDISSSHILWLGECTNLKVLTVVKGQNNECALLNLEGRGVTIEYARY